ncbi:MAG: hypothetical protein AMXMBFR64_18420 [Myxococcales bacterium]
MIQQTFQPSFDIEAELARFEAEERARLGIEEAPREQWVDANPQTFTKAQRAHTTILVAGLTMAHDLFVEAALGGLGYKIKAIDVPDYDALRVGKEFGNRGQCNPTYFTVGNLVKHLQGLERQGLSRREIIDNHVFLTAGACGPCRFGTYVTEYRKALRDSGFEGFRVVLFQQQGGLKQATGEDVGLELSQPFFLGLVKALLSGDVLNALGYRIRPYEVEAGATDAALERCKRIVYEALHGGTSILLALLKCRRELAAVKVDRTTPKPKVAIIGEFWAMTTEGDGNYRLQRFLESEGAEVDVQLVTAWILFMVWEHDHDTRRRMMLRGTDDAKKGLAKVDAQKKLVKLWVADKAVRAIFQTFANLMGLHGYHLPDMHEVARISARYYNNDIRGGEAHMEVGKLIQNVLHSKVNMTLSVKPFGCMPSSGVSDGVQSLITELLPGSIFLPIETSGDGAVNVQSRVLMTLFKAKQAAQRESEEALARWGLSREDVQAFLGGTAVGRVIGHALFKTPHHHGSSAADMAELVGRLKNPVEALRRAWTRRESAEVVPLRTPAREGSRAVA